VEEGVAGPIREFDESKPLLRIEPLDDSGSFSASAIRTFWAQTELMLWYSSSIVPPSSVDQPTFTIRADF
jgi:hypothetical protein